MNSPPVHRLYLHFQELPPSMRTLFTVTLLVLGCGYIFAMIYIFESHAGRDGNASLSVQDLIIAYSGSKEGSRLETAIQGPMANMLPISEAKIISAWVRNGSELAVYEENIQPILKARCTMCHDGSNPHIPNLSSYEHVLETTQVDKGADIFTLVRVSHIHLFGMTFIFFIMSLIFSHAFLRPIWLKCLIVATPFVSILLDVFSWYLTKVYEPFAWVVMISGVLMGVAFAFMWIVSMYQLWFYKMPEEISHRSSHPPRIVG